MIYEIELRIIMANLLKKNNELTVKQIIDCKKEIATKFPEDTILINVSAESIGFTIENHPYLFRIEENKIKRALNSDYCYTDKSINSMFNNYIPKEIKKGLLSCLD